MLNTIRSLISQNRVRYIDEDTNLDLTYITDNIIAMAAPSIGLESIYRNSLHDVKRFLDDRHGDRYKIFNLRSERSYEADLFEGAPVAQYPFDDHQSPPFDMMLQFCQDAAAWLKKGNVVVVHCKAGKGRTGTMVASLLLYLGEIHTADDAMFMYGAKRTKDGRGITIPSQRRYVHYFEKMLKNQMRTIKLKIIRMVIHMIPNCYKADKGRYLTFSIYHDGQKIYDQTRQDCEISRTSHQIVISTPGMDPVEGDFKVKFARKDPYFFKEHAVCHFWLHTGFLSERSTVHLEKKEIDKAFSDEACIEFDKNFSIDITFEIL